MFGRREIEEGKSMMTIFDWFGFAIPYPERFRKIREAGFDGVLLYWSDEYGDTDFKSFPRYAEEAGLTVENIHTSFKNINSIWADNQEGTSIEDYLLQCVDDCAVYGIPTMIVHLSSGNNPPPMNPFGVDRIKRIVEKAEKYKVHVALENLRNSESLGYILGQIDSRHVGFCYDSGHHHCWNPKEDLLMKYGSRLMALHLHDNDGTEDEHRLPFDGTIDWNKTMRTISQTKYSGAIALEVMNRGYEALSAEEFLRVAFERAKKLEAIRNASEIC